MLKISTRLFIAHLNSVLEVQGTKIVASHSIHSIKRLEYKPTAAKSNSCEISNKESYVLVLI